ncbi:hypothetical protein NHP21005_00570 [Helicobacter sp. NHP21005]|nr:hypothetical protein NHP21005_00570 [Helicobacter sp. NHP21005]
MHGFGVKFLALMLCGAWLGAAPFIALGEPAKYQQNFTHFDYANPNAPKGATQKLRFRHF